MFRGEPGGSFGDRKPIRGRDGEPINVDLAAAVSPADWDADGDLDLMVGTIGGAVHLIVNHGSSKRYSFGKPQPLIAEGNPIVAGTGCSAPTAADWDGDGKLDLVVGTLEGSVLWYRNLGSPAEPKLAAAQTLVLPPEPESERGTYAKICVTDFNQDGRLDLLVGDHGKSFVKELSDEEILWREEVRSRRAELLRGWADVFRQYGKLLQAPQPEQARNGQDHKQRLEVLRGQMRQLSRTRDMLARKEQALKPGEQRHGHVWLFLRK